jgi:hypothetical protein
MITESITIEDIPATLLGEESDCLFLSIDGMGRALNAVGSLTRSAYEEGWQIISIDLSRYGERTEIDIESLVSDLRTVLAYAKKRWHAIALYATDIGAYASMLAFAGEKFDRILFTSPILDLADTITYVLEQNGLSTDVFDTADEVTVGDVVIPSRMFRYASEHRITNWSAYTIMLYPTDDHLTPRATVDRFCDNFCFSVTFLLGAPHRLNTDESIFLRHRWENQLTHGIPYIPLKCRKWT